MHVDDFLTVKTAVQLLARNCASSVPGFGGRAAVFGEGDRVLLAAVVERDLPAADVGPERVRRRLRQVFQAREQGFDAGAVAQMRRVDLVVFGLAAESRPSSGL
ncbi:hypothetical protein LP419_10250 [Massilia sp. H-1]|nr:hypothetical protein LP419_10250 [Massilia sp. H-1]